MRTSIIFRFLTPFFLLPAILHGQSSWEKIPGPYGLTGSTCTATQGDSIYMIQTSNSSDISALYRSDDGGRTWRPLPPFPIPITIGHLAIDSAGALIAGGYGGTGYNGSTMLRSTDGGNSWRVLSGMTKTISGFGFQIARDGSYLVAPNGNYIFRSSDHGQTWDSALVADAPNATSALINIGVFPSGVVNADVVRYSGVDSGTSYWISNDHGATWTTRAKKSKSKNYTFYVIINDSIFYRNKFDNPIHGESYLCRCTSSKGCSQEQFFIQGFSPYSTLTTPGKPLIFAIPGFNGSSPELHRSTDIGETWTELPRGTELKIQRLARAEGAILSFPGGGPYRSEDEGETWQVSNEGVIVLPTGICFPRRNGNIVIASPNTLSENKDPIYEYEPLSGMWQKFKSPYNDLLGMIETGNDVLYIYANQGSYGRLFRRSLGDTLFEEVTRDVPSTEFKGHELQATSKAEISSICTYTNKQVDLVILGLKYEGFHVYDPATDTWREWSRPDTGSNGEVTRLSASDTHIFATQGNALFRTTGTDLINELSTPPVWSKMLDLDTMVVTAMNANRSGEVVLIANNRLQYSSDKGETWETVPLPASNASYRTCRLLQSGQIVASVQLDDAGRREYANYVINTGATQWTIIDNKAASGFPVTEFTEAHDGTLYAMIRPTGVYRLQLPSSTPEDESIETSFSMRAVPNPSSGVGTLQLTIMNSGSHTIQVWGASGQAVTPPRRIHLEAGEQTIPLEMNDLPSGLYRCEVISLKDGSRGSCPVHVVR